jgi:hypothetical protein
MGKLREPRKVKLIASIIYKDAEMLELALARTQEAFGPLDVRHLDLSFDSTDYYYAEFGVPLKRRMVTFRELMTLENIENVKLTTNRIEADTMVDDKRRVNIDPGYLNDAKLVLFTTKDYSHRIYLKSSIFAESTLYHRSGSFKAWPWTYPDYSSDIMLRFMNDVREAYMAGGRDVH